MDSERFAEERDDVVAKVLVRGDEAAPMRWRSLEPGRRWARPLRALAPDPALPPELRRAVAEGLVVIAAAVQRSFPHNVFCDLDLVAGALERGAARHGLSWVHEASGIFEALHDLFGCATSIRFRYVHDFLYGYDWARWVQRDPEGRGEVGPFDLRFLSYARTRGGELTTLIAAGDRKYHPIAEGTHRNPFPFARDPESEIRLLEDLAARGWIPVEAWRRDATPRWDRPYSATREARARELGLSA